MKKVFFTILITFFAQSSFAQKIITEEERQMTAAFIYEMYTGLFNSEVQKFKTVVYNPGDYYSETVSNEKAASCFKLMNETAKLGMKNEELCFEADVPEGINDLKQAGIKSVVDISIHENKLFYGKDTLKINAGSFGMGYSLTLNQNNYEEHRRKTRNYHLDSDQTDITKIHGSLIMKVDFLTGYNSVSFTNKDIGKKITLGDESIEIVNIINDLIVLKGNVKDVNVLNFISDNKVAKPLSDEGVGSLSIGIYKSVYESIVLKKMSLEEFDKFMTVGKIDEMQYEELYTVKNNINKTSKKFILYKPVYKTYFLTANYK